MIRALLYTLLIILTLSACAATDPESSAQGTNKVESNKLDKLNNSAKEEPKTEEDNPQADVAAAKENKDSESNKNSSQLKSSTKGTPIVIKDESDQDPSLQKFLEDLETAIDAKDKDKLLGMLSEDVTVSFGGRYGKEGFVEYWNLQKNPSQSEVWLELKNALELGGAFHGKEKGKLYAIPYIFNHFPEGYDPFLYSAVVGQNVNVRASPSIDGKVIEQLSYVVVKNNGAPHDNTYTIDGHPYHWIPIITPSDQKGYMIEKYVRSPIDYRIGLSKTSGEWEIYFFVAGD